MPDSKNTGPLADVRVLDLSRMYPGAYCTLLLADMGADVLKLEAPGFGDGLRVMAAPGAFNSAHTGLNRGKRSMVLDTRKPGAADVLRRLARNADVVVESARPGAMETSGIGFSQLREENPGLIWCSISGFGQSGPNANEPGHDITYLGYSGLLGRLTEDEPSVPNVTLSLPTAALMAVSGILAALHARHASGVGAFVDANMVDSAMWLVSEDVARAASGTPNQSWGSSAARAIFRCADGRYVTVAASEPRTWAKLCEALELPGLAAGRPGAGADTKAVVAAAFATKPAAEWQRVPGLAGGVGPVNSADDLVHDPQVLERDSLVPLADGSASVLANPLRFDGQSGDAASHARSAPPALGADTDAVLAAAGFSADEIAVLRADGVV